MPLPSKSASPSLRWSPEFFLKEGGAAKCRRAPTMRRRVKLTAGVNYDSPHPSDASRLSSAPGSLLALRGKIPSPPSPLVLSDASAR